MNQTTEQLQKRLEILVDRYKMRKTGKSLFAVRHERMKQQKNKLKSEGRKKIAFLWHSD